MEIIYTKFQLMPDNTGVPRVYFGHKLKGNNLSVDNENLNKTHQFPNYNYPDIELDYKNSINHDNLSLVSLDPIPIQKNINIENPALFLEFLDLRLDSKLSVYLFIRKYGFLTNSFSDNYNKANFENFDSLIGYNIKNEADEKNLFTKNLYSEPFSIWILFQARLRNLVSLWRFLITSSSHPHLDIYAKENFRIDGTKSSYKNIKTDLIQNNRISILGKNDFFKNKKFKDLIPFILSPEINLTEDHNTHEKLSSGLGSFNTDPNFYKHFSNEFLLSQLNILQNFFKPRIEVGGKLAFSSSMGEFPFTQNLQCTSLISAIVNQFIEAIQYKKSFIRCHECRKWILKISVRKEKKLYCGDTCRSKANRTRKYLNAYKESNAFKDYKTLSEIVEVFYNTLGNNKEKKENLSQNKKNKDLTEFKKTLSYNIIMNFISDCSHASIAYHLGIDVDYLGSLDFLTSQEVDVPEAFPISPYRDWSWHN